MITATIPVESKLPRTGTTIFTIMSRLAEAHGAVNLSQGFPDFDPPGRLLALVEKHLRAGHNQYAPMPGVEALRIAVAAKTEDCQGVAVDPASEVTITAGATEALLSAIHAVVRRQDEVVVFDPAYDSYEPAVTLAGGVTRHVPLRAPAFEVDWQRLESALGPRTRLVIINSPHNPTGSVLTKADLDRLADLLRRYDCFVLSDEVYEHVVFDGHEHVSVLTHPELAARAFCVSSFGKTFHATGWKLGYCIAPGPLTAEFRRIHQYAVFAAVTPIQHALADYLDEAPGHYRSLPRFYQDKRDYFLTAVQRSRLRSVPSSGTYFQLADYSDVSDLPDVEFARWLTVEHGVATIPISVFYQVPPPVTRLVRFCFAKKPSTIDAAAARLAAL